MSKVDTVKAVLDIEILVECPNPDCGIQLNLLQECDTDGCNHDDERQLSTQVLKNSGSDFECADVTCTYCKTTFNVRELELYRCFSPKIGEIND